VKTLNNDKGENNGKGHEAITATVTATNDKGIEDASATGRRFCSKIGEGRLFTFGGGPREMLV
jgi:hypothetical protein